MKLLSERDHGPVKFLRQFDGTREGPIRHQYLTNAAICRWRTASSPISPAPMTIAVLS